MDHRLSLSWDSYQKSICNGFTILQQRGEFVDMTLAADGHHVKVHQMVMSLVSPYIKELITSTQSQHPVIFLNKMSFETLQLILEYAYTGEVLLPRENLHEFLEACRALQVKGLEDESLKSSADRAMLKLSSSDKAAAQTLSVDLQLHPRLNFEQQIDNHNKQHVETIADFTEENSHLSGGDSMEEPDRAEEVHPQLDVKQRQVPANTTVQYSLSCQGSIMILLNRYLYRLRYSRKNSRKTWRCADYFRKKCPAYVVTKGDIVLERGCAHNHPFHDRQILKRLEKGNVFAHFTAAQNYAALSAPGGSRGSGGTLQRADVLTKRSMLLG